MIDDANRKIKVFASVNDRKFFQKSQNRLGPALIVVFIHIWCDLAQLLSGSDHLTKKIVTDN